MKITQYNIVTSKPTHEMTIACVSDLHAHKYHKIIVALKKSKPDIILLAGDIIEVSNNYMKKRNENALKFFEKTANIAPTYYCFGNHEIYYSHTKREENRTSDPVMLNENISKILSFGVHIVNDCFESISICDNEILIGGLVCGRDMDPALNTKQPDLNFIDTFDKNESFKILICHYPHYYEPYLKKTNYDVIVSGHAHGGQWRIFGHGIYSPHQGLFPRYTSGIHDGRFIINRGAVNNSKFIPRFFNPTEILQINIKSC